MLIARVIDINALQATIVMHVPAFDLLPAPVGAKLRIRSGKDDQTCDNVSVYRPGR